MITLNRSWQNEPTSDLKSHEVSTGCKETITKERKKTVWEKSIQSDASDQSQSGNEKEEKKSLDSREVSSL